MIEDHQRPENELHDGTHVAETSCWCQPKRDPDETSMVVWIHNNRAVA